MTILIVIFKYFTLAVGLCFMGIGLIFMIQELSKWLRGEYK